VCEVAVLLHDDTNPQADLQHVLMGITLGGKLGLAPIPDDFSGQALDLATGKMNQFITDVLAKLP
jgi:hypothetical protein